MKDSQEIYQDLVNQYHNLSDLEKNAILIYQSKLFIIINKISQIPYFDYLSAMEIKSKIPDAEVYENILAEYNKIVNNPQNYFIKYSIFKDIHLNNFVSFIEDVKRILQLLRQAASTMILNDDLVVYRGMATDKESINFTEGGICISTSIKLDTAFQFMKTDNVKPVRHLYQIKLNSGTPLFVSPYSIVKVYDSVLDTMIPIDNQSCILKIMNRGTEGQYEITLIKDMIEYQELSCEKIEKNGKVIFVHHIEVFEKKKSNQVNL